jgi:cell division protein FtsN
MGYQNETNDDNDDVVDIDNRKMTLVGIGFLAICGFFFVVGYIMGHGAAPAPVKYTDAGDAGNSKAKDDYDSKAYNRMDEIDNETYMPPSAVTGSPSARQENSGSAAAVSAVEPPAISVLPVYADKPKPQPKETSGNSARASAEKPSPSVKQAASAKPLYAVQVAAFHARREAESKANELETKGFEPRIEPPPTPGDYYRIKVGGFATRAEAAKMAEQLKKSGFETMISEIKGN